MFGHVFIFGKNIIKTNVFFFVKNRPKRECNRWSSDKIISIPNVCWHSDMSDQLKLCSEQVILYSNHEVAQFWCLAEVLISKSATYNSFSSNHLWRNHSKKVCQYITSSKLETNWWHFMKSRTFFERCAYYTFKNNEKM